MKLLYWSRLTLLPLTALCAISLAGCATTEPVATRTPTLSEARLGNAPATTAEDTRLAPGEIEAEVAEVNRPRQEIYVLTPDRRRQTLRYDPARTRVTYHGRDYLIDDLEAGDRIAYRPTSTRSDYIDTVRIEAPVQARSASRLDHPRRRADIVEGTVERVDESVGVFDVRPRSGRTVTVSVPYNARPADIESFRSLRRGDSVRVEGEFVSQDNLQLLSFLSTRDR